MLASLVGPSTAAAAEAEAKREIEKEGKTLVTSDI